MKKYDLNIIGGGGGTKLRPAADLGKQVAIIEKEDLGGTCLNRGCIPSKMLIHTADVADEIRKTERFNLKVNTDFEVEFEKLVKRVNNSVAKSSKSIENFYRSHENIDFYHSHGQFIKDKVIEVDGKRITADKIFIATGARPKVPNIPGLNKTPFMTSREALKTTKQPKKLIVIGVGYIGVELGHFFGALGTEVHFFGRDQMLRGSDNEIVQEFRKVFEQKYRLHMNTQIIEVKHFGENFEMKYFDQDKAKKTINADALLLATGIEPNTKGLGLEKTGIRTNEKGYIKVDDYLQTDVKDVFALGDVIGRYFFRHSVNFEGEYLLDQHYKKTEKLKKISYPPMPHAVFSNPQIAGVGKTEEELQDENVEYIVGKNYYKDSAMGDALRSENGLVKILIEKNNHKLVGAHICGEEASDMIHMLIAFMNMDAKLEDLLRTIYIHPALPENIRNAARDAQKRTQNKLGHDKS